MAYHESVDKRVELDKNPDGGRHVAHARPHAQHGAGVVVGLQGRAGLALGQDDEGVEDLVELAEVKEPAVVGKALVPDAAGLRAVGQAGSGVNDTRGRIRAGALEAAQVLVEVDRVAEPGRAVQTARTVGGGGEATGPEGADDALAHAAEHAPKGPGRVDGQEDVVEDDEEAKRGSFRNAPGLLVVGAVVAVQQLDGDGVERGNGDGHARVEGTEEEPVGNVERPHDGGGDGQRG